MPIINAYHLKLRPVEKDDLELLRRWRNSDAIRLKMLDQTIISANQQKKWFKSIHYSDDYHFIVEYKEKAIAYANYKSDTENSGETGLYIGDEKYRGTVLAFCLALALLDFIFIELNISQIHAIVLSHNQAALNFNKKIGYLQVDKGFSKNGLSENKLIYMQLTKKNYLIAKDKILSTLRL